MLAEDVLRGLVGGLRNRQPIAARRAGFEAFRHKPLRDPVPRGVLGHAQQEQMQMYMEQLQYLDSQKDAEQKKNQENQAKLQDFLQREVEKKNKLDAEVKKLEDRTLALNQTRNDLFKQLNGME